MYDNFSDVYRQRGRGVPAAAKWWYAAAVATLLFAAWVLMPWHAIFWDFYQPKPQLPASATAVIHKRLQMMEQAAHAAGPNYRIKAHAQNVANMRLLEGRLDFFSSTPAVVALKLEARSLRLNLGILANQQELAVWEKSPHSSVETILPPVDNEFQSSLEREVSEYYRNSRGTSSLLAGIPTAAERGFHFPPEALLRLALLWLLTLIPAAFGMRRRFLEIKQSYLAEWLAAPLPTFLTLAFWLLTLKAPEFELGVLRVKLHEQQEAFRTQHGHWPSETETAALYQELYAQARGRLLTAEQAVRRITEMDFTVRPRRAVYASLVVMMLTGWFQTITSFVTMFVQAARAASPVPALVDSTTVRRTRLVSTDADSGNVVVLGDKPKTDPLRLQWVRGYAETRMSNKGTDAITMPTILIEGSAGTTDQFLEWSYSATTRQFLELAAVYKLPPFKFSVGNVWDVIADDAAPPRKALFPGTPVGALVPDWNGIGASGYYDNGGFETSVAVLNTGTPTHRRLDVSGRVTLAHGPFTAAVTAHGGASGSYFAQFVTAKCGRFLGELAHGHRDDLRKDAQSVRFVATAGRNRVGVLIGRPSVYTLSVERRIGGMSRLVGDVSLSRRGPPLFQLRFGTLATTEP